jgi:hypothetical protein
MVAAARELETEGLRIGLAERLSPRRHRGHLSGGSATSSFVGIGIRVSVSSATAFAVIPVGASSR